jgi:hypothetical protein
MATTNKSNNNENIKIKNVMKQLKYNSFYYLLLVVTFLTSIPTPALGLGTSTVPFGIICVFVSIQMILGFKHIYLPEFLLNIKIKKSTIEKITSYITRMKKVNKVEDHFFNLKIINTISGLIILFNGILMTIPIVFTNWHPSISTSIISLSHIIKNKKLLILFYFLSIFMFIGYAIFFYFIYKSIKNFSSKKNLLDIFKSGKNVALFYLLGFFFICASMFLFLVTFGLVGLFSKNMYVKFFSGK